ncbi:MAG TPA: hypothetical protein VNW06_03380 [Cytophagaceae bacterium]|nr:hypothetical protein [Cytophagaceae bacterium]
MADETLVVEYSMKGVSPDVAKNYREVIKDIQDGVYHFDCDTSARAENYTKETRYKEGALHYQPGKAKKFKG